MAANRELYFVVGDVYHITGRGPVAFGELKAGTAAVGDAVVVTGADGRTTERGVIAGIDRGALTIDGVPEGLLTTGATIRGAEPTATEA